MGNTKEKHPENIGDGEVVCGDVDCQMGWDVSLESRGSSRRVTNPNLTYIITCAVVAPPARHVTHHLHSAALVAACSMMCIDMTVHYRRLLYYIPCHRALQLSLRLGQMGIEGLLN